MKTNYLKLLLGWRNWAVFNYNSIFENFFIFFFISFSVSDYSNELIKFIFLFSILSFWATSYGYLINDYADIELDNLHNKKNTFSTFSKTTAFAICVFVFIIANAFALPFINNNLFLIFWLLWLFLTTFYSIPPFRFKEKDDIGLILVVSAQRLLPVVLLFIAYGYSQIYLLILLSFYVFLRGLSSDINHQIEDINNDLKTGTQTFAAKHGKDRSELFLKISLNSEKVILLFILILLYWIWDSPVILSAFLLVFIITLYLIPLLVSYFEVIKNKKTNINPFVAERNIFQYLHHSFPSVILPLFLAFLSLYFNYWFLSVIIFLIFIKKLFKPDSIKNSYLISKVLSFFKLKS